MAKLVTADLVNLENQTSTVATLNSNFGLVEVALENTLSRDGSTPNSMGSDLDMNSFKILNLPTPTNPQDPVRLQDLSYTYITSTTLAPTPVVGDATKIVKVNAGGTAYSFSNLKINASDQLTNGTGTVEIAGNASLPAGYIQLNEISAPSAPAANLSRIYSRDNATVTNLYFKDSTNLETRLDIPNATATEQEAAASSAHYVTPAVQHRHPSSPKAWAKVSNTPALLASYGVASVSSPGTGRLLVTLTTPMSSANYCVIPSIERASTLLTVANTLHVAVRNATMTTTTFELECYDSTATTNLAVTPTSWHFTIFGDQ